MSASSLLQYPSTRSAEEPRGWSVLPVSWPGRERLQPDFRLERRRSQRWRLFGTATLLGLGPSLGTLLELTDLDCAPWWLAGESDSCVVVGTRVSVGFSNPACRPDTATAMRCERTRDGRFRIALRFDGAFLS